MRYRYKVVTKVPNKLIPTACTDSLQFSRNAREQLIDILLHENTIVLLHDESMYSTYVCMADG